MAETRGNFSSFFNKDKILYEHTHFYPIIGLYPHCLQSVSLTHVKMEEFVIWIPQTTTACVHRVLLDHAVQSNYVSYLSSQYPVVLPFSFGQWCWLQWISSKTTICLWN